MNNIQIANETLNIIAERKYNLSGMDIALPDVDFEEVIVISPGDGEELLISRESGKIFSFFDGETEEYEDFDDLLTCLSGFMEHSAEEYLGKDWGDIYDERFELG